MVGCASAVSERRVQGMSGASGLHNRARPYVRFPPLADSKEFLITLQLARLGRGRWHMTNSTLLQTFASKPWNKGCLIGPKLALKPRQVWSIRFHLQREGRVRDLALFDLAVRSVVRYGATSKRMKRSSPTPAMTSWSISILPPRSGTGMPGPRSGRPLLQQDAATQC
jgi:hypothetical protein